jgi:hypothetical protein
VSLIKASAIPDLSKLDPEAVHTAANTISGSGTGVSTAATEVVATWGKLPGVYEAPEGPQLYAIMDPVQPAATAFQTGVSAVASALHTYADAMATAKTNVGNIKSQASTFEQQANHYSPKAVHTGDWYDLGLPTVATSWDQDPDMVKQNNALITSAYTALAEFENAQKTCAAAIMQAADPNACVAPAALISTKLPKGAATKWGTVSDKKESCGNKAEFFGPQLLGGAAKGLWGMVGGISDLATGWDLHSWPPPSGFAALKNQGQAWLGLGETALGLVMAPAIYSNEQLLNNKVFGGKLNGLRDFNRMLGQKDLGFVGSLVGWQQPDKWWDGNSWTKMKDAGFSSWVDDPGGQTGQSVVAIGSFFIPGAEGAGAIGKAGDVADAGKLADAGDAAGLADASHVADTFEHLAPGADASALAGLGDHVSEAAGGGLGGGTEVLTHNFDELSHDLPAHDPSVHEPIISDAPHDTVTAPHEAPPTHSSIQLDSPGATIDHGGPINHGTPTTDGGAPVDHGTPTDTPPGSPGHDGTPSTHLPTDLHHVDETGKVGAREAFAARHLDANTVYNVPGRGIFHTDATGHVVLVETRYGVGRLNADLQHPIADATYHVSGPHGLHEFHTDSLARVDHVKVDTLFKTTDVPRSGYTQTQIGKLGGDGFDGGHLIANFLGGGPEKINMVAMLKEINRGGGHSYYNFENEVSKALGNDGAVKVKFSVDPVYEGTSKVPSILDVGYKVGKHDWEYDQFINKR